MIGGLFNIAYLKEISSRAERIRITFLCLFAFSLPFERTYSSVILLAWMLASVLDFKAIKEYKKPNYWWVFPLIWLLSLSGYFYSLHKEVAASLLERQLSFLLFPLFLPLSFRGEWQRLSLLLDALALGSVSVIVFLFYCMLHSLFADYEISLKEAIFSGIFFQHAFSQPVSVHAGYLSLFVSASIIHLLFSWKEKSCDKAQVVFRSFFLLILAAGLLMLASRNTIITTLLILGIILPLKRSGHRLRSVLVLLILAAVPLFVIYKVPPLRERFLVNMMDDISWVNNSMLKDFNAAEPRHLRWKGAFRLVKRSPVAGYGTGDERSMLQTEYIRDGLYISFLEAFDAHNQYLSVLLKHGLIGLTGFLLWLCFFIRLAIAGRNPYYQAFWLLMLLGFFTENLLDSNKGIFFFVFFNTLFGHFCLWQRSADRAQVQAPAPN